MEDDRQKVEGSRADRKGTDWQKFNFTQELIILGLVFIAWYTGEKEICIAVVAGLTGYLTRKSS